jgi:PRTRC genetic system ThiF family protein
MSLARLAVHVRERGGLPLELCFVDSDRVERTNLGRQLFSPAELGRNKAVTLAGRLNAALGLAIQAVPMMATAELLRELAPSYQTTGVLVGAVDRAIGRRALHQALAQQQWRLWLDVGNEHAWGTVLIGSATERRQLSGACALGGLCTALPAPSLGYPHLLDEQPLIEAEACAPAMRDERQSLMVNQAMAAVAGQYLYQLIIARQIRVFEAIVHDLRMLLREIAGRGPHPTAAICDSRTLQSSPESGERAGYDGAKRRKGSKVHAAVDTLGHLLALLVTPANEQKTAHRLPNWPSRCKR